MANEEHCSCTEKLLSLSVFVGSLAGVGCYWLLKHVFISGCKYGIDFAHAKPTEYIDDHKRDHSEKC